MADSTILMRTVDGASVAILAHDTGTVDSEGRPIYTMGVNASVSIDPGDISIGAIEIKDVSADTRATVDLPANIDATKNALAVQAAVLGGITGSAVITDANGTLQNYLRGLVKLIAAKLGVTIADGDDATQGVTTGAAVITDSNGTVQQYLRGVVKLIAAKINVKVADGDDATQGITTGAAVVTDANGTIQQYARGLVKMLADVWDSTNHLLKVSSTQRGVLTDRSTTTSATPATSTQVMAANAARSYLLFQNLSNVDMYVNFTTAAVATQPSIRVPAGGNLIMDGSFVSTEALTVICSLASQAFAAKEG